VPKPSNTLEGQVNRSTHTALELTYRIQDRSNESTFEAASLLDTKET